MCSCVLFVAIVLAFHEFAEPVATAGAAKFQSPQSASGAKAEQPESALSSAARRFRMQVYATYRSERSELDRRRAAWEHVQRVWRDRGARTADVPSLLTWLDEAAYRSREDVKGPLPSVPDFEHNEARDSTSAPKKVEPASSGVAPVEQPPPRVVARRPAPLPTSPPTKRAAAPIVRRPAPVAARAPDESLLDVGELLARATGYGVGLRTVDSVLLDPEELNVDQLSTLLDELERLVNQRRDLLLYENLVSSGHRDKLVKPLVFPRAAIAQLGTRVAALREEIDSLDLSDSDREPMLQALDRLSVRLAALANRE
jgi:hypothetical protein